MSGMAMTLAERLPELLSHCRNQEITVKQAYEGELNRSSTVRSSTYKPRGSCFRWGRSWRNITSPKAKISPRCPMTRRNGELEAGMLYRALKSAHGSPDAWATFVWQNKAPPRVKFFVWLLSQNRIQCETALKQRDSRQHNL